MKNLFNKLTQQFQQGIPFVIYNKPNSKKIIGIFQENKELYFVKNYEEKGFVFAPFNGNKSVLIPENHSTIIVADFEEDHFNKQNSIFKEHESDAKNKFEAVVKKGIGAINNGNFKKVVLSRKESVELSNFDLVSVFEKMLNEYKSAFTYCFYHPEIGLWLGAFSEQLIKIQDGIIHTMALAGTQTFQENETIIWQNKEKEEQQFVTDFIIDELKNCISTFSISEPYTLKAGNVFHIKTDIKGTINKNVSLAEIINILHPTPAVCGFPKKDAKDFILKNEGYDREYYSGFLGEINKDFATLEKATDLFVNLRCMKIEQNLKTKNTKAHLYIGCGITKDSKPEKEWLETVNKSLTIKKCLEY